MFGKGVHQEEEALLREIIRTVDKKLDYTASEGEGSRFTLHVSLKSHQSDIVLDMDDLTVAKRSKHVMITWTNHAMATTSSA